MQNTQTAIIELARAILCRLAGVARALCWVGIHKMERIQGVAPAHGDYSDIITEVCARCGCTEIEYILRNPIIIPPGGSTEFCIELVLEHKDAEKVENAEHTDSDN